MTITADLECRDMIGFFVYRPRGHIIGVAIVAVLTIIGDTRVSKVQRRPERICRGVANDAVLGCR